MTGEPEVEASGVTKVAREHRPDCPAAYFTDHPERCRCVFMAMLDRPRPPRPEDE